MPRTSLLLITLLCVILVGLQETVAFHNRNGHPRVSTALPNHRSNVASSSRRDFFANAASAVGGATAVGTLAAPGSVVAQAADTKAVPLSLPPIGLGCWAWGDAIFWGYNPSQDKDLNEVFDYVVAQASGGSNSATPNVLLDTAELYGLGRSESLIGEFSKNLSQEVQEKVVVATKFAPYPFRTKPENVVKACQSSLKRLGGNRPIDLYQIHFPNVVANEEYWDGLANAYEQGLVKAVGVSNYGVDALKACHTALEKRGVPLSTNQIQYSLLYRFPEDNGLLQACQDLGVQVLSYSPLALGLLTGKYTDVGSLQQVSGPRKALFDKTLENPQFQTLLDTMKQVASNHDNANVAQVAINWCRTKGTIPIPGARNLRQIQSNYGALTWELSKEEVALLDRAALFSYNTPDLAPFPRQDKTTGLVMFDS
ncbi:aldo/keto reductase family protein [Nitzschia inconspicua]|uniref:Aldo/keto reductase family protein n=1 Tax=Nitzschia inconspicua TaxID=303405 RepID=A0A9K3K613_9STRA|nr:aldo/keto reductase family protein [Nitzschia inconspicua]KAG7347667.1 aldo/keto reductase family protein [Nitzschia inconspicua]